MSSTTIKITGHCMWARVFPENKDLTGYEDAVKDVGGQYTIDMDLDEESVEALSRLKSQAVDYAKTRPNQEGEEKTFYRFKRIHEKYDRKGNLLEWASGAPTVVDADGDTWSAETDGFIGNGSKLELTVVVYTAGRVVGTRLEQVKVLDYVAPPEVVAA